MNVLTNYFLQCKDLIWTWTSQSTKQKISGEKNSLQCQGFLVFADYSPNQTEQSLNLTSSDKKKLLTLPLVQTYFDCSSSLCLVIAGSLAISLGKAAKSWWVPGRGENKKM